MKRRGRRMHRQLPLEPGAYHAMTRAQKLSVAFGDVRPPPMRCARCLAWVDAAQVAAHIKRCTGSPAARDADVMRRRRKP